MTKRITITSGDYVLLSDIPNEQVFNLVKECFGNAGFPSTSFWEDGPSWSAFYAVGGCSQGFNSCSSFGPEAIGLDKLQLRKLSLSDVFNSTNGKFDWMRCTIPMHQVGVERDLRVLACYDGVVIERIHTAYTAYQGTVDYSHVQVKVPNTYKITRAFDIDDLQHTDISSVQGRALGKSTAHHLELISKAMKSPEQWVKVYSDYDNLERHNRWAFEEVRNLCHKLGLDWMEFSVSGNSIRYMPYQTVKMVTKWEVIT